MAASKAPQYNTACAECMKIHASSGIGGLQKEVEDRISNDNRNIDPECSHMNLTIHGRDASGKPIANHDKPPLSLEDRIMNRIKDAGAVVRRDRSDHVDSKERGHNSKESVVCEGIIFQISHERAMELLQEDGMLDADGKIRKDCELSPDSQTYAMFMDTYDFACERFGEENIVGAYIHLDEYTPHMHLFVVPISMKESRYGGQVRTDESGKPIKKGVLDAKHIFSPSTIKQLWSDYADALKDYGVSKAEGKVPKGMYTETATMDAVIRQKENAIQQRDEELKAKDSSLEMKQISSDRLEREMSQMEKQSFQMQAEIEGMKIKCQDLEIRVNEKTAELSVLERKLEAKSSLGPPPEKTFLGYRSEDVERYIQGAEAREVQRQIEMVKIDDLPTRQELMRLLQEQRHIVAEHKRLVNDPDALIQKANELKEQQFQKSMTMLAQAVLGCGFMPYAFYQEETVGGIDRMAVGRCKEDGSHRAFQIMPDGKIYSTNDRWVCDLKTADQFKDRPIWEAHGTMTDLRVQIQTEWKVNDYGVEKVRFGGYERKDTPNGPEYLFYGNNGRNYMMDVSGNIYSSPAEAIPNLDKCHERQSERIWRAEITYKEVTSQDQTKSHSQGMKR